MKTLDSVTTVKNRYPDLFVVGFSIETTDVIANGNKKLVEKNLDMIAINDVADGKVFNQAESELTVITQQHKHYFLSKNHHKDNLVCGLLEIINVNLPPLS